MSVSEKKCEKKLNNVNFSKCILMMLVILGHCLNLWTDRDWFICSPAITATQLGVLADWLTSFHTYTFVLISGYVFYFLKNENGRYGDFYSFVVGKIKRLIVPFAFVLCVWVLPFAIYFFKYDKRTIIQKYLLGTSPNQLWFLLMLFWVYIIAWILNSLFKEYFAFSFICVLCLYAIGVVGNHATVDIFNIWSACKYVMFFWIGFQLRGEKFKWINKINVFILILINLLLFILSLFVTGVWRQLIDILLHIEGAIMAFLVLDTLANRINWNNKKLLSILLKFSMPMYLFHQQIVYCCIIVTNGKMNPYINAIYIYIFTVIVSFIISKIMMSTKITRKLIGEK